MREKITVLIADDNQEFSMTLATYLKNQEDMTVVGMAKDGNEALDMIPNLMPDVVLLDVIMPHLDGIGVLEKLNMIKLSKKPICIMLSAVGQDKITRRAVELGAEYYVVKPFDIDLLISSIREFKNYKPIPSNSFISSLNLSAIIAINSLLVGFPFAAETVYPNIFSTTSGCPLPQATSIA